MENNEQSDKFIFFCIEEQGSATNMLLIPYNNYINIPLFKSNCDTLKQNSNSYSVEIKGKIKILKNVVYQHFLHDNNLSASIVHPFTHFVNDLFCYVDRFFSDLCGEPINKEWYNGAIPVSGSFDAIDTYVYQLNNPFQLCDGTFIDADIVESFLVLEKRNSNKYNDFSYDLIKL